jgi:hypothetical protein
MKTNAMKNRGASARQLAATYKSAVLSNHGAPADGTSASMGAEAKGRPGASAFRRDHLPPPLDYYADQGLPLHGRGPWRDALCPFHSDSRPSLRVNASSGAFRCMACGASGGDVLAYHMRRYGMRFVDAAKALGAWEVA